MARRKEGLKDKFLGTIGRKLEYVGKFIREHPIQTSIVVLTIIISLSIRLHLALTTPLFPGNTDPVHYNTDAMNFFEKGSIPQSIYWPPGYVFFLIPMYALFGKTFVTAKIVNVILSLVNAGLVYYLGKKLFNKQVGLIGLVWMLFDPLLTFYATNVYTETLFISLLMGSLALAWSQKDNPRWWKATIIGLMMGFNALIKPWVLVMAGAIVFWWFINKDKKKTIIGQIKIILPWTAIMLLGIFIALTPWTIHNAKTTGHFVPLPVNGPLNFYLANHEYGNSAFTSNYGNETMGHFKGMNDYDKAQKAKELAKAYVMEDVGRFIKKIWFSFSHYWSHPNKEWYQRLVPHFDGLIRYLWIQWVLVIGGLAYSIKNWKENSANYLFLGLITAVYTMATYLARFKIPMIPFQIIYGAVSLMLLFNIARQILESTKTNSRTNNKKQKR